MMRDRGWRKRAVFIPEETRNIKKMTCTVCGRTFYPKAEYIARDRVKTGGLLNAMSGNSEEAECYDAMDCPECGCQMILKKRLERLYNDQTLELVETKNI